MRPLRRQPTRLPRPWDSPGKNTGVGCHVLLQCMKVKSESEVAQSCPTLHDPMDCSLPGSSIHGIFQARVLEWGVIAFSDSEGRSLYISLSRFPFGKEIRELSKGSHTSGQHCFSNCDRSWLQEWALLQVEVQKLLLKKAVRVFKSPFYPKSVTRNRRELTPGKDWSGMRSSGVKT